MSSEDWMIGAMCYGKPTRWWFPQHRDKADDVYNFKVAKKICSTCPVKKQCLEYGQKTNSFGVWGGVTLQGRFNRYGTKDTTLDVSSV
jgi:hypothetical protein